jgi:hypothetical protein
MGVREHAEREGRNGDPKRKCGCGPTRCLSPTTAGHARGSDLTGVGQPCSRGAHNRVHQVGNLLKHLEAHPPAHCLEPSGVGTTVGAHPEVLLDHDFEESRVFTVDARRESLSDHTARIGQLDDPYSIATWTTWAFAH